MLRLYHCANARSMRSLWLLRELEVDFDLVELPFDVEHLRAPDYLAIHPLGRVPALVDDGVVLFESGAICEYLCERYDDGRFGRAPGHPERTEWLQWLHYAETIAVHAATMVQQTVVIAEPDRSPVVQKLETRRLEKSLDVLDAHLTDREHVLRSGFSAPDTNVGYSVHLARRFTDLGAFAHVEAYYRRLAARAAFQASLPAGPSVA